LVGPFKKAKGGFTHIFMAVNKFTKWILVKLTASITAVKAVEFIKEIMYMFGICRTPFQERGNEASICVPRMFKSHV
jgi:hypothetical protein